MQDSRPDKSNVPGGPIDNGKNAFRCLVPVVMPPIHLQSLNSARFSVAGMLPLPSAQVTSSAVVVDGMGWNRRDERAGRVVVAPAQSRSSASSTVLSHCDGSDDACGRGYSSSDRGGSSLKEHDYIGLSEVSSSPVATHDSENITADRKSRAADVVLNLKETDLRLGLGPPNPSIDSVSKVDASAGFLPVKGIGSSPDIFSNAKPRSVEQNVNGANENVAPGGCDSLSGKDGSTRLRGYDSLETTGSSSEEVGVAFSEDAADKRYSVMSDKSPSSLWPTQVRRHEEGIRANPGLDFSSRQAPLPGQEFDVSQLAHPNSYASTRFALLAAKNGVKRAYDEAMVEKRFNYGDFRSCSLYDGMNRPTAVGGVQFLGGFPPASVKIADTDLKRLPQQTVLPQSSYVYAWSPVHPSALGTFGQFQSLQGVGVGPHSDSIADPPVPPWEDHSKAPEAAGPVEKCLPSSSERQQASSPEVASQKGQVVGWPPIRSFRKNSLSSPAKPVEGEGSAETPDTGSGPSPLHAESLFVKVNMDGVPIGRKVDLNACNGYEALILALEEMFQRPNAGQGGTPLVSGNVKTSMEAIRARLINGSDFILTYEDKDGDWMLVGDVPWGMFVSTVKRLWIMKATDATGLVPRGPRTAMSQGNARSSVCS